MCLVGLAANRLLSHNSYLYCQQIGPSEGKNRSEAETFNGREMYSISTTLGHKSILKRLKAALWRDSYAFTLLRPDLAPSGYHLFLFWVNDFASGKQYIRI